MLFIMMMTGTSSLVVASVFAETLATTARRRNAIITTRILVMPFIQSHLNLDASIYVKHTIEYFGLDNQEIGRKILVENGKRQ